MSTETALKPNPSGPGKYRLTQKIQPGWQFWDSGAGEWLTMSVSAEFNTGRIRFVCDEKEDDGTHVTFDTTKGHSLWTRTTAEQKQAAKVSWNTTVDGRHLAWRGGKCWELVKLHEGNAEVPQVGWYLREIQDGQHVVSSEWAGDRIAEAKAKASERINAPVPALAVQAEAQTGGAR